MTSEQRMRELPKAIIQWYEIKKDSRTACIVSKNGNSMLIAEALEEKGLCVDKISLEKLDNTQGCKGKKRNCDKEQVIKMGNIVNQYGKERYDSIIVADIIEYACDTAGVLECVRSLLRPDGKLIFVADNRLGIRYFCGDQDIFTGKNYDSIENYVHLLPWECETMKGRAYSKAELTKLLEKAGFHQHRFFSVFPRISNPQLLLAEDYVPNEALDIRVFPEYNSPNTVFLLEEELYPSLMENQMLHVMANGFWVECPLQSGYSPVNQVTLSGERGAENAMATIVQNDGFVKKRALYCDGEKKLQLLLDNHKYLSAHGICMVDMEIKGNTLVMPYVAGIPANDYFRNLMEQDKNAFLAQLDAFWNNILHSSEHACFDEINWDQFEPGWEKRKKDDPNREKWKRIASGSQKEKDDLGIILKRGYLDLVSLNCFYLGGRFVFYDQELYMENVPVKAIMLRTIEFIYKFNDQLDGIISRNMLLERYGITKYKELYDKFISHFLNILRRDDGLSDYFKEGRRDYGTVMDNRRRLNYAGEEYTMIFKDIFHHIRGRRLYLFGSGKYAQRFLEKYGQVYSVTGYLDNDNSRWGAEIEGKPILNPAALKEMNPVEYKVIVCIRNYMPVVRQLRREGIPNFSVYDPNMQYQDEMVLENLSLRTGRMLGESGSSSPKKYNIGYVAGVFDLFHIGHLNLFQRAKEQCNYLIVGVVTDEGVIKHKKSNPKIPFEERIAIVRACRYVDEAVEIPLDQGDTNEAYRRYRFDVQFSGSDYADDPKWGAKKEFLQKNGADLVFFPYTEGISTTQLKDAINSRNEY